MVSEYPKLQYFIAQKGSVLIVSLVGPLVRSNAAVFEECMKSVAENLSAKWVIVNLRDASDTVDRSFFPAFARFQKMIRSKPAELRLSSIHPKLRKELEEQGLLRMEEIKNNLTEALQNLVLENVT